MPNSNFLMMVLENGGMVRSRPLAPETIDFTSWKYHEGVISCVKNWQGRFAKCKQYNKRGRHRKLMILAPKTEIHGVFALKTKDSDVAVNKNTKGNANRPEGHSHHPTIP